MLCSVPPLWQLAHQFHCAPMLTSCPQSRPRPLRPLLLAAQLLSWLHDPQRWSLFFLTVSQVATGAHKMTPVPFGPLPFIAKREPPFPQLPRPRPVCISISCLGTGRPWLCLTSNLRRFPGQYYTLSAVLRLNSSAAAQGCAGHRC